MVPNIAMSFGLTDVNRVSETGLLYFAFLVLLGYNHVLTGCSAMPNIIKHIPLMIVAAEPALVTEIPSAAIPRPTIVYPVPLTQRD
jgi:hypothetical protein